MTLDLHIWIDEIFPPTKHWVYNALGHALVDLGQVQDAACAWSRCVSPLEPLEPIGNLRTGDRSPYQATWDHIIARANGGTDHWSNLQLLHHTCNMRKSAEFDDARRAQISEANKRRWEDPVYRARMAASSQAAGQDPTIAARKSAKMKEYWANKSRRGR